MLIPSVVYILTTKGPVRIQRIAEEDPAVRSVICLDGRAQSLPVSAAYDAFVRRPTGVIERLTGHAAYRMDVSARIDDGRSWQLAAFLAHLGLLQGTTNGVCIFATGEVDSQLDVRAVDEVVRKFDALAAAFPDLAVDPARAMILVPATETPLPARVAGIPVYRVASIDEALKHAGLEMPNAASAGKAVAANPTRRTSVLRLAGAALVIAALMFWFGLDLARWAGLSERGRLLELETELASAEQHTGGAMRAAIYRKWLALHTPSGDGIDLDGQISVADGSEKCVSDGTFRTAPLTSSFAGAQPVCEITIRSISSSGALVGRLAYWPDGLGIGARPLRVMRGSTAPSGRIWNLTFEHPPQPGAVLRLIVITGVAEVHGAQPWYADLLGEPLDSPVYAAAVRRLDRLGYHVSVQDWHRD